MRKAHERDSVLKEKFWFRKHLAPPLPSAAASEKPENPEAPDKAFEGAQKAGFVASSSCQDHIWQGTADEYELMSVEEILNGKGDYFLGLIPLCHMYLDYIGCVTLLISLARRIFFGSRFLPPGLLEPQP
jgi:glutamate--cysteine ligase catalytic subunit